jgi:hypothetical protein
MGSCNGWRYNTTHGLFGLVLAAAVLVALRHDLAQGLSLAVVITSATGWTRGLVSDGDPGEGSRGA